MKLEWDSEASQSFINAIWWIQESSMQNAEIVESAILDSLQKALKSPESFPLDKYRLNNDGTYRAFETHSFRVSYPWSGLLDAWSHQPQLTWSPLLFKFPPTRMH